MTADPAFTGAVLLAGKDGFQIAGDKKYRGDDAPLDQMNHDFQSSSGWVEG
jgi:hypothetical protein